MTCWRTTFLAIRAAIWPQKNGVLGIFPDNTVSVSSPTDSPDQPATTPLRHDQTLHLAGCHFLAAPVILFRLKRTGYSACRAVYEAGGLTIHTRR